MSGLTWGLLEAEVIKLAKESPSYSDPQPGECQYLPDSYGYPGCIVGQAMNRLGVPDTEIYKVEGSTPLDADFAEHLGLRFTSDWNVRGNKVKTARRLAGIQARQDEGLSWEQAIKV